MKLQKRPRGGGAAARVVSVVVPPQQQQQRCPADPACPICQEEVGRRSPDGVREAWALTPCGHVLGSVCLKRYLAITDRPACPVCRRGVFHLCGHPVLPVPYDPAAGAAHPWDGDPRLEVCPFCRAGREPSASSSSSSAAAAAVSAASAGPVILSAAAGPSAAAHARRWRAWRLPKRAVAGAVGATVRFARARVLRREPGPPPAVPSPPASDAGSAPGTPRARAPALLPPVPGPYGHWEPATREPDWDFIRWFDMQEPRTSAAADLLRETKGE